MVRPHLVFAPFILLRLLSTRIFLSMPESTFSFLTVVHGKAALVQDWRHCPGWRHRPRRRHHSRRHAWHGEGRPMGRPRPHLHVHWTAGHVLLLLAPCPRSARGVRGATRGAGFRAAMLFRRLPASLCLRLALGALPALRAHGIAAPVRAFAALRRAAADAAALRPASAATPLALFSQAFGLTLLGVLFGILLRGAVLVTRRSWRRLRRSLLCRLIRDGLEPLHDQSPAPGLCEVEGLDATGGLVNAAHGDESEALPQATFLVTRDIYLFHGAMPSKELPKLFLARRLVNVFDKYHTSTAIRLAAV
mmetsp:Transcript_14460/g.31725  ORF Transcript_14460/g.31725 Transcript_14460/m.31725 type:complete len:306 (+) Transcript_14460:563-1480(+)